MPADPLLRAEVCQVSTSGEQYGRVTELEDGQYVVEWSDGCALPATASASRRAP